MAHGKASANRPKRRTAVPGFQDVSRLKRVAEVTTFRNDLRQAELRRNYELELGNIRSALYGRLSPGVTHRLHNRRDEVERLFAESLH